MGKYTTFKNKVAPEPVRLPAPAPPPPEEEDAVPMETDRDIMAASRIALARMITDPKGNALAKIRAIELLTSKNKLALLTDEDLIAELTRRTPKDG
jgi:hypothetical protein